MWSYLLLGQVAFALAVPLLAASSSLLVGTTAHEVTQGECRDNIYLFARASTQQGNLGKTVGFWTANELKMRLGDTALAVEGLDYAALIQDNLIPGGTTPESAQKMARLIEMAATKCPKARLLLGGYSQGAAVIHRAMEQLARDDTSKRVAAIVTFGDTQNKQDGGRVPGFPQKRTKIICNPGDGVCNGTLVVTPEHMDYAKHVVEGVDFLMRWAKK